MSASPATSATPGLSTRPRPGAPRDEPLRLRLLEIAVVTPVLCFLVWSVATAWPEAKGYFPEVLAWVAVVAIADLMPIRIWGSVEIAVSFPVLLAAGMVFPPYLACFLAFVAPLDARELRREIAVMRGLFNRANIAVSVLAASSVFHTLDGDFSDWPSVVAAGLLALAVDVAVNGSLVALGTHLLTGVPVREVWAHMTGRDAPVYFLASYFAFGLLALLLSLAHEAAGTWGLAVFTVPLLLTRQMFVQWRRFSETHRELSEKEQALVRVTQRIADERRDERLAMAADIHDELLPSLHQVHLMAQVLKQDLAHGRLLELEEDLPELQLATDRASDVVRAFARDLRASPVGSKGLVPTLRLLVDHLTALTASRFELDLEDVGGSPMSQLLVYQVAREALTNAARHAEARTIRLWLSAAGGFLRVVVQDDGRGFDHSRVDRERRLGLQIVRDRIELFGGVLTVDSVPGEGTTVAARLPLEVSL